MKKSIFAIALTALGAGTASAAEIEFWHGMTGTNEQGVNAQCAAFNEAQSEHKVTCIGQGTYEASMQKAIAAYRSGQHPTLIQFFEAGTLDLMLSGAVVPVQELLPEADWPDYINGARSYYETSKGELYSQPYNGSTMILLGNKEMLAEVGVTELPATYEGLIEVAQKLKDNGHACPVLQRTHPWHMVEQVLARHGEPLASKGNGYDGLDAEYVLNGSMAVQHIENIAKWREQKLFRIESDVPSEDNGFVANECAIIENSSSHYASAFAAMGDNILVGLAPVYEGRERYNTLIGGASIWVMKGKSEEQYEAAKAFLNFVRQDDQQIAFTRITGYAPVTKSALESLLASDDVGDPKFATAVISAETLGQPTNENSRGIRLGFYVQFRDILKEETSKTFNGQQSVQVALDNAVKRGNELLRRFEQTYKGVSLP